MKKVHLMVKVIAALSVVLTAAAVMGCANGSSDSGSQAGQNTNNASSAEFDNGLVTAFTSGSWGKNGEGTNAEFTLQEAQKAVVKITNVGANDWDIQLIHAIAAKTATKYQVKFDITSTVKRTMKYCLITANTYDWQGGEDVALEADSKKSVDCTITTKDDFKGNAVNFQISLGKFTGEDTPAGTITIENVSIKEVQ